LIPIGIVTQLLVAILIGFVITIVRHTNLLAKSSVDAVDFSIEGDCPRVDAASYIVLTKRREGRRSCIAEWIVMKLSRCAPVAYTSAFYV
jgi:hypothetical protein